MPLRRLVLLTAAVCLLAGLVTVVVLRSTGSTRPEVDVAAPAYAYTTLNELVVMRGDKVLVKANRPFDRTDSLRNQVAWSNDGRYVTFLAGADLLGEDVDTERLVAIDTETGEQHEFRCPKCSYIAAVGADEVLANDGKKFRKFALNAPGRADGTELNQPPITTADKYLRVFLAGTRDLALTAGQVYTGNSTYGAKLELLSPDGKLHLDVDVVDSNVYLPAAGISGPTAADTRFAVAVRNNPGLCEANFPVRVVDAEGQSEDTDWGAAAPPGFVPNKAQGIEVRDLWWDNSRTLHATIVSWTCDETKQDHSSKKVLHSPSKLWKLEGRKWVLEDDSPATVVRPLADNGRAVLSIPDCVGPVTDPDPQTYCHLGKLQVVRDGQRKDVATGVLRVYAPPAVSSEPVPAPDLSGVESLKSARVPSLCGHPEGALRDGKLPGIPESQGFVSLAAASAPKQAKDLIASGDVTGDGKPETAAVFYCSQGGVAWPDNVVVYDDARNVVGAVDLGKFAPSSEKASVQRLEVSGGNFEVRWQSYQGAGSCKKTWSAQLKIVNKAVEVVGPTLLDGPAGAC